MTVAEKLKSWLDEIGADGLMFPDHSSFYVLIEDMRDHHYIPANLVPAFRHADGSFHIEPDISVCAECSGALFGTCDIKQTQDSARCDLYKSWLAHKEATK